MTISDEELYAMDNGGYISPNERKLIDELKALRAERDRGVMDDVREAIWQVLDDMDCFDETAEAIRPGEEGKGTQCCIGARIQLEEVWPLVNALTAPLTSPAPLSAEELHDLLIEMANRIGVETSLVPFSLANAALAAIEKHYILARKL